MGRVKVSSRALRVVPAKAVVRTGWRLKTMMMRRSMMNSRKFPRTLDEAFPKTAEYGCAIERPHRYFEQQDRIVMWACVVGAAAVVLFSLVGWLK
jgi:hypothetical protein